MANFLSNLFQPIAPGLSGAINPLTFIGAGMASGDMGSAMGQMATIQQNAARLQAEQQYRQAMAQKAMQEAQMQQQAMQQSAAQRQAAQVAAAQLLGAPMPAEGPPTAAGDIPTVMGLSPQAQALAMGAPGDVLKTALDPSRFKPIKGGEGGFFDTLTQQVVQQAPGAPGGMAPAAGMTREEFMKEYSAENWTPQSWVTAVQRGAETGTYDPRDLQAKGETFGYSDQRQMMLDAGKEIKPIRTAVMEGKKLLTALDRDDPLSDLASIYGFMKFLDPRSVVREGETAMMTGAQGIFGQIDSALQRASGEGQLSAAAKSQIKGLVGDLMDMYRQEYGSIRQDWLGYAKEMGARNPERVVGREISFPEIRTDRPVAPPGAGISFAEDDPLQKRINEFRERQRQKTRAALPTEPGAFF